MKITLPFILALVLCSQISFGQKRLSKEIKSQTFDYTTFDVLTVSDDFVVNVTFANTAKPVVIRANANLMEYVKVTQSGGTLVIDLENPKFSGWWTGKEVLEADIVIPVIKAFNISGDAIVKTTGTLKTSKMSLNVKSDGVFKADLEVDKLVVNGKSDAEIFLTGTAGTMNATLKSDAELLGRDFSVGDLIINMASDAEAKINVTGSLDAYATGDAELTYFGNPKIIRQKATGDAEINSRG